MGETNNRAPESVDQSHKRPVQSSAPESGERQLLSPSPVPVRSLQSHPARSVLRHRIRMSSRSTPFESSSTPSSEGMRNTYIETLSISANMCKQMSSLTSTTAVEVVEEHAANQIERVHTEGCPSMMIVIGRIKNGKQLRFGHGHTAQYTVNGVIPAPASDLDLAVGHITAEAVQFQLPLTNR